MWFSRLQAVVCGVLLSATLHGAASCSAADERSVQLERSCPGAATAATYRFTGSRWRDACAPHESPEVDSCRRGDRPREAEAGALIDGDDVGRLSWHASDGGEYYLYAPAQRGATPCYVLADGRSWPCAIDDRECLLRVE